MSDLAIPSIPFEVGSLRRHAAFGIFAILGLLGGLSAWAATTQIQGAVVAAGVLFVEGMSKQIQHMDGGIVSQIMVRDEDEVAEGSVLLTLDTTAIEASLAVIDDQRNDALVIEARAVAALDNKTDFDLPAGLAASDPAIAALLSTQRRVLSVQSADRDSRINQLLEQVAQLNLKIDGLRLQLAAIDQQSEILGGRVADMQKLFEQNLVDAGTLASLKLQLAGAEGEHGRLISEIGQSSGTIAEKQLQVEQIRAGFQQVALDDLQRVRQIIAETSQQKRAAEDKLNRATLRAPQAGIVHESIVHTIGGVVTPGQVLMKIVPQSDELLIEIHIDPADIDQVTVDQRVQLRFTSLDQRQVPDVWGTISRLSPDRVVDTTANRSYYTAEVHVAADERAKLPEGTRLLPGMPVEAFVATGERTVLDYLLHPFIEELQLTFRER